jgi:hypothetical protein
LTRFSKLSLHRNPTAKHARTGSGTSIASTLITVATGDHRPVALRSSIVQARRIHMRKLIAVLLLLGLTTAIVGCQASGKVDDNGVKANVDTK